MVNYCPKCGDIVKGSCSKCASAGLAQKADSFAADGDAPVSVQYTDAYVSSGLEEDMDTGLRRMADVRPELQDKDCYHCNRKCTGGAVAGPYGPNRGKPFCQTCFANIYDREKCEKCGKSILGSNEEWVEQDGKKYHGSCFEDKDCEFCHQPIIGSGLEANGKMYHPNCFTCEECQKPIAGGAYAIFRGAPYCQPCHSEVAGKPKASSVSSSKTYAARTLDLPANLTLPVWSPTMRRTGASTGTMLPCRTAAASSMSFVSRSTLASTSTARSARRSFSYARFMFLNFL